MSASKRGLPVLAAKGNAAADSEAEEAKMRSVHLLMATQISAIALVPVLEDVLVLALAPVLAV